jgi:hydroxymethylbilane synthase
MVQTNWVARQLRRQWPDLEIAIEQIRTTGDRITNKPLTQIGGDGVFVVELERALLERHIDLAVHSLKDLPTVQPDGLRIFVTGPREDVRDVFVSHAAFCIAEGRLRPVLPDAKLEVAPRIGTCSLRRTAQIRAFCPAARILPLRGNVDTRLRKLEAGEYDGIVLAAAGLHRLALPERPGSQRTYFPIEMMIPAPGQGALGLEMRDEPEMCALLAPFNDTAVQAATSAERMFMRRLGAGCYLPVAAYGAVVAETLTLLGLVISLDGHQRIRVRQSIHWTAESSIECAERLGSKLAEQALAGGADKIIRELDPRQNQEHQRV